MKVSIVDLEGIILKLYWEQPPYVGSILEMDFIDGVQITWRKIFPNWDEESKLLHHMLMRVPIAFKGNKIERFFAIDIDIQI